MNHFPEEMKKVREAAASALIVNVTQTQNKHETMTQLEQDLRRLLHSSAEKLIGGDRKQLDMKLTSSGFTIVYQPTSAPPFIVSSTYNDHEVTLNVTDGHWQNIPNNLGNWANWTDQKPVYIGPLNEHRIRRSLERAFLLWYKAVVGGTLQ